MEQEELAEAIRLQQSELARNKPEAYVRLITLLLSAGNLATAHAEASRAITGFPTDANIMYRLSEIEQRLGNVSQAIDWARRSAAAEPKRLFWHDRLGHLLLLSSQPDEAGRIFEWILSQDPNYLGAWRGKVAVHSRRNEWSEAAVWQRKLIGQEPGSLNLRVGLIDTLLKFDQIDAAREEAKAAQVLWLEHPARPPWPAEIEQRIALWTTYEPAEPRPGPCSPWHRQHEHLIRDMAATQPHVVFLGDSITAEWRRAGRPLWDEHFARIPSANIGLAGDNTQAVLWRLMHGGFAGINPRIVVLMIGTNNVVRSSVASTTRGVVAVLLSLRTILPASEVLLLGLLQRVDQDEPIKRKITDVNAGLSAYARINGIRFIDLNQQLLEPDGCLLPEIAPDGLHLSFAGYQRLVSPIAQELKEMLRQSYGV